MAAAASAEQLYAQAEAAERRGDVGQAVRLSTSAVAALFQNRVISPDGRLDIAAVLATALALQDQPLRAVYPYLRQLGGVLERDGALHGLAPALAGIRARLADPHRTAALSALHVATVFALLGYHDHCDATWAEAVLSQVALPWMEASAQRGDFETAIAIENVVYSAHVKRQESQAWFKATTARWIPQLAAAARTQRPAQPRRWIPEPVRRVGFFVHNATMLAHIVVLIETLKAAHDVGQRNYEFTVFVMGGRNVAMHAALAAAGVKLHHLDEGRGRERSYDRLLAMEQMLAEENFGAIFWISLVTLMAVAFPRRMAPLQGWWAMKYHACDIDEIDVHLAVENVVLRKTMEGREWLTLGSASTSWLDPGKAQSARELRASFPADAIVAASIGREEKLDSPEFVQAVCALLRAHPRLIFLWTGRVQRPSIQSAFDQAGVADRARFVGWVDTKVYAQAIDLFLDSFPFPCGFTLKEAMAAGKPAVLMRTPESLETGVPGAISPLLDGSAAAPAGQRERLRAIFTNATDFDLYRCAGSPAEYVALAGALIDDASMRARVGAANRAFIEGFLMSPHEEGRKFLDHLDELFTKLANP